MTLGVAVGLAAGAETAAVTWGAAAGEDAGVGTAAGVGAAAGEDAGGRCCGSRTAAVVSGAARCLVLGGQLLQGSGGGGERPHGQVETLPQKLPPHL